MEDNKLAAEEARRAGQHGSVKSQVEGEVQAEIAERAADKPAPESDRIDQVAGQFRAKAVDARLVSADPIEIASSLRSSQ